MVTFVPIPTIDSTFKESIKLSIIVKPIPDLSKFPFVVNNGFLASSTFSIPCPLSDTSISISSSNNIAFNFTIPSLFGYACIILLVTASDTDVLISAIS